MDDKQRSDEWMQIIQRGDFAEVERRMRKALHGVTTVAPISTRQLRDKIWPGVEARGATANEWRNKRLYDMMKRLAKTTMADCAKTGAPTVYYGSVSHPTLWHAPDISREALAKDIAQAIASLTAKYGEDAVIALREALTDDSLGDLLS